MDSGSNASKPLVEAHQLLVQVVAFPYPTHKRSLVPHILRAIVLFKMLFCYNQLVVCVDQSFEACLYDVFGFTESIKLQHRSDKQPRGDS
jgi:hypothetical protein